MRSADELFRIGSGLAFEAAAEAMRIIFERAALGELAPLPSLIPPCQTAVPWVFISGLLVVAKSQDAKLEDDPSSNHAMTVGLQFSAMPLPLSSFIAFSFLGRCDNPMPRKTFGALVNWTLS